MAGGTNLEIERPRSATELIGATFTLYRRYPWLFLALAAVVVLPYQAVLAIPALELVHGAIRGWFSFFVGIGEIALVVPLVSALHVYAVDDVRQGRPPKIGSVGRRGLATLSVVSPAVLLSWLGITFGLIALIVPGVILLLRWSVVAQTASLGASDWPEALGRSKSLTEGRYQHVFALVLFVLLITELPSAVLFLAFGLKTTALAPFLIRSALSVLTNSFTALATAMLYFDLKARPRTNVFAAPLPPKLGATPDSTQPSAAPTGHPLDPASWSDEDRPSGWYVDPDTPWVMRYWLPDGPEAGWSKRTAKTPKATLAAWKDMRWTRDQAERPEEPV
jgi:hypothetical protein